MLEEKKKIYIEINDIDDLEKINKKRKENSTDNLENIINAINKAKELGFISHILATCYARTAIESNINSESFPLSSEELKLIG